MRGTYLQVTLHLQQQQAAGRQWYRLITRALFQGRLIMLGFAVPALQIPEYEDLESDESSTSSSILSVWAVWVRRCGRPFEKLVWEGCRIHQWEDHEKLRSILTELGSISWCRNCNIGLPLLSNWNEVRISQTCSAHQIINTIAHVEVLCRSSSERVKGLHL